ncbi:MAG: Inner membrane protein YqjA [Syntrophorhabdaceae bacterium PtaU1.Bin034]|nr:MAG: Inner membrane protein YqjA [Syntrophorhabdaceae bacterium PtaU1.Bin034]
MEIIICLFDYFVHLDRHLGGLLQNFGGWTYLILFLVIFCETGLVVTPVLPGDSLLFALGAFAANPSMGGVLELDMLMGVLIAAAILGDTVNYAIGKYLGPRVFRYEDGRFFRKAYLERTREFYEKYGGKTIIIARFLPILRTFAPFVAGIGRMRYPRFVFYNIAGGVIWIASLLLCGYFFGNIPIVKNNFALVLLAIVFFSVLPGFYEYLRQRKLSGSREAYDRLPSRMNENAE